MRIIGVAVTMAMMAPALAAMPDEAQAPPMPALEAQAEPPPHVDSPPAGITEEMIRKAVRETIAEDPRPMDATGAGAGGAFSANAAHARMSAAFEEARVPDCMHPDALKNQPAMIGPIQVVGMYQLPWLVAAVLRGKCN